MALIFKCELCERIEEDRPGYPDSEKEYCDSCANRLVNIEVAEAKKAHNRLGSYYKKGGTNNAELVEFCTHIMKQHGDEFIHDYGYKSWSLLVNAVK